MKTYLVTVPVTVPDEIDGIDLCNTINTLINIGLADAADTAGDDSLDGCEEAKEVLLLKIKEPFMYDDDAKGFEDGLNT